MNEITHKGNHTNTKRFREFQAQKIQKSRIQRLLRSVYKLHNDKETHNYLPKRETALTKVQELQMRSHGVQSFAIVPSW